jgi:cytochrome c biogenesis protein CcdA
VLARFLEALLFAIGFGLLVYGASVFTGFYQTVRVISSVVAGILFLIAEVWIKNLFRIDKESIAQYVSLHHPELEFSTDLLI